MRTYGWVVAALWMSACAVATSKDCPPDAATCGPGSLVADMSIALGPPIPGVDGGVDLGAPKKFGDPCTDKAECASDICVFSSFGGVCSDYCPTIGCPAGYGCYGVLGGGIDPTTVVELCVPDSDRLCSPCDKDSDCGSVLGKDHCLTYPTGSFCGRDCSTVSCPPTYSCQLIGDGGTVEQCMPDNNACDCTATNVGMTAGCVITTPTGSTCNGSRKCNGGAGWGDCVPPATSDVPDAPGAALGFVDADCDGIDGEIVRAIFVAAPPIGSDSNPGTMASPVATIERGITLAVTSTPKKDVYVSKGAYYPSATLSLASGISLYGLYDASNHWQRDAANTTTINGDITAVTALNLAAETHVEGFQILASDAGTPGTSSYGVVVYGGTGNVMIRYNTIVGGVGADGTPGANGANGGAPTSGGGNGADGCDGCSGGGTAGTAGASSCGGAGSGGAGGLGGYDGTSGAAGNGSTAWNLVANTPGAPGASGHSAGVCFKSANAGGPGVGGSNGADGTFASASAAIGTIASGIYVPGFGPSGVAGGNGTGGGGGGGGGGGRSDTFCNADRGGGGGGGGAGGCGGAAGVGGRGGGGSFAVFVSGAVATVSGNTLVTRRGGHGGTGGTGGIGSSGSVHGNGGGGKDDAAAGGIGGDGGKGGTGASGTGGPGGPSIGVASSVGTTVTIGTNSYSVAPGGFGGTGGSNTLGTAPQGATGLSAQSYTF